MTICVRSSLHSYGKGVWKSSFKLGSKLRLSIGNWRLEVVYCVLIVTRHDVSTQTQGCVERLAILSKVPTKVL